MVPGRKTEAVDPFTMGWPPAASLALAAGTVHNEWKAFNSGHGVATVTP
jgi:hypothetical protein